MEPSWSRPISRHSSSRSEYVVENSGSRWSAEMGHGERRISVVRSRSGVPDARPRCSMSGAHRLADPTDPVVIKAFEHGALEGFERHSPGGHGDRGIFRERDRRLRKAGAKYIFLNPCLSAGELSDLALALASKFRLRICSPWTAPGADGHESLAHDERMGCAPCGITFASLSICKISCWKEKICPCIGGERWIHL